MASMKQSSILQGVAEKGSVLQVVSTTKLDSSTTTSGTLSDISGLTLAITPATTSSKVMVFVSLAARNNTGGRDKIQLVRDSTSIATSTAGSDTNGSFTSATQQFGGTSTVLPISFNHLDSPSSSTEITYRLQFSTTAGTLVVGESDNGLYGQVSSITLMEVAG